MSKKALVFFSMVCLAGLGTLAYGALHFRADRLPEFISYLLLALMAARLKVKLPEIDGTVSVNFLFILLGITGLSLAETLIIGGAAIVAQCFNEGRRWPKPEHVLFNVCCSSFAVGAAYAAYHGPFRGYLHGLTGLLLMFSACIYFVFNTLPVAAIISLTENKRMVQIWKDCYFWSFPYYLVGAAIAGMVSWADQRTNWQASLLAFPAMFVIYRSYRLYLSKLDTEKRHVEAMAALHLRTIEALALAIEAKDQSTHDHLRRVRVYAVELGNRLGLSEDEMDALRAAALLHDIGKLAVPEHILSKPGRLTAQEFEKVKIHPVVGAEILERVQFPYPVAPIVRAHHEKWDGTGYPDGLKGEEIPVGARILAAVDCFDALASHRPYRAALPLEDAMRHVKLESGKSYDPKVVEQLESNYVELEQLVRSRPAGEERRKLTRDLKVSRGQAPAAGLEAGHTVEPLRRASFLTSIAAARDEVQTLFELSHDLGASLSLDQTLSVLGDRLKKLVPHDAIAAFVLKGDELVPEYLHGENASALAQIRIPLGAGVSGWVAQNSKPLVNGDPALEPGYRRDEAGLPVLRSALSVPLEGLKGVVGVLTLYDERRNAYTADHLRILTAISSKVALSVENALAFRQAESFATTDYLTGLPNARSLFLHLERELARCQRLNTSLTVMVCDLNGFKQVNDRFGHLAGNSILSRFARSLQDSCREYDYPARMGGDEFVMVAPGLSLPAATARGVALSALAQAAGEEVCGESLLSLSVGCAMFPGDGAGAEEVLAEADRRMYNAKQQYYSEKDSHPRMLPAPPVTRVAAKGLH